MRFVRPAESVEEQNLSLIQDGDQLFFIVTKNINAKQELKVAYSSQYASQRSLKLIPQGPNKGETFYFPFDFWIQVCLF